MTPEVVVVAAEAFAAQGARRILRALGSALEGRDGASLALAGGSTPLAVYRRLAEPDLRGLLDWSRVEIFWSDERCVPPDAPASNYRAARESLLRPLGLAGGRVHPVPTERDPAAAAAEYEREVRRVVRGDPPRFDLVLLGVGEDGHTASLFPDLFSGGGDGVPPGAAAPDQALPADALPDGAQTGPLVVATRSPLPPSERVSFGYPLLSAARKVLFLVCGPGKAAIVSRLFAEPGPAGGGGTADRKGELPAARIAAAEVTWLLDAAAAAALVG